MVWCGATEIVDSIIDAVIEYIPQSELPYVLERIVSPFLEEGWDCEQESRHWPMLKPVVEKIRPSRPWDYEY